MRFRAGDDIRARIRASLVRRDHACDRKRPAPDGRRRPPTRYGPLGEMGAPEDRADPDEWGHADTGTQA